MNRKIYRKLARQHGVTVAEVKQNIQEAINAAYTDPDRNLITIKAQNAVLRRGEIPTPDELINYAAAEVRRREKEK
ncbi:hypothetical protein OBV_14400 [Oscillibacter valericigenes Sjm18-20]|nr:hypothetical protein OBV_14400 [Oscillibacter valericigenes Sjm18-20]